MMMGFMWLVVVTTAAGDHFGLGRAWRRTALVRRYRFLI